MNTTNTATVQASPAQPSSSQLQLSKRALSLFFRVGCERQFLLYLYDDDSRRRLNMPPRQGGRAGMGLVGRHGYEYQAIRIQELCNAFGKSVIVGPPCDQSGETHPIPLGPVLAWKVVADYDLIVEPQFRGNTEKFQAATAIEALRDAAGSAVVFGSLRPDLVQILPPLAQHCADMPNLAPVYAQEVLPDGSTQLIDITDRRRRLRVCDIKLASEPGAHYFAEVVFYSIALAAWLHEENLHDDYAVVAAPAVVPGSFEPSTLLTQLQKWNAAAHVATAAELSDAFENDLSLAPVEAFAPRIRDLLRLTLPRLLQTQWQDVAYHVDVRCRGCEFLGDPHIHDRNNNPTQHALHCWAQADTSAHLSRVVGLSRGATIVLRESAIPDARALADVPLPSGLDAPTPPASAFQTHHGLRARRTLYPARARALACGMAGIIADSGGDALMPRWPALHVYIFLDYDPATAITATLGLRAFWKEPLPFDSQDLPQTKRWGRAQLDTEVFLVDRANVVDERREFLRFLRHLRSIFHWVETQDETDRAAGRRNDKTSRSSYQIYLWDEAQRRHLVRLVSRHLPAILAAPDLREVAWLFPPPELLANPDTGSRRTPYTIVHDVVQNTIALPTPHHYTLFEVARGYNATDIPAPNAHPLYFDTLSNLAPPERIHELWTRVSSWQEVQKLLVETAEKKLLALGIVVASLERGLRQQLGRLSAPCLPSSHRRPSGLAIESQLWLQFTQLNAALQSLDVARVRAMPPHEREARFKSAHLVRRLRGVERLRAWPSLVQQLSRRTPLTSSILIYELAAESRDLPFRQGEIGYALAPMWDPGFLDRYPPALTANTPIGYCPGETVDEAGMTAVSILAIDRVNGWIALQADRRSKLRGITRHVRIENRRPDLSRDVMLDPVHQDFLTKKVLLTLQGIGNPTIAKPSRRVLEALGLPMDTPPGSGVASPAATILWDAVRLHAEASGRDGAALRADLEKHFKRLRGRLMPDQGDAVQKALGTRFTLLLGPPGTGKSYTLRAVILGAVLHAVQHKEQLRLLVTANTYTAVDNVLLALQKDLSDLFPPRATNGSGAARPYRLVRLQSGARAVEHDFLKDYPDIENLELNSKRPSLEIRNVVKALNSRNEILLIGAPTQQVHNLAQAGGKGAAARRTQQPWFDLIILDEASQVDVAASTLIFSKCAPEGACVLAGDDRQLPPIHQADAPEGLEANVGSIYTYMQQHLQVPVISLETSFRSNETLVALTRATGYSKLRAHSPALALDLSPISSVAPTTWPSSLPWSPDYARILDPGHAAVCLVHDDRQSAQSNHFEADHVAALVELLRRHLQDGLRNELNPFGEPVPAGSAVRTYAPARFLAKGVGIVVPHRAQMSAIVSRLQPLFTSDLSQAIRGAVDTVERFQGQERDVIIASFGVGDPDVIAAEEEFLYNLRRFNVMVSRARAKLIVFVARSVVEHLSDDSEILAESLLLKRFVEQFCEPAPINPVPESIETRWSLRWR